MNFRKSLGKSTDFLIFGKFFSVSKKFELFQKSVECEVLLHIYFMAKKRSASCCSCSVQGLFPMLTRIVVAVIFIVAGYSKFLSPEMFQEMLASKLGLSGSVGMIAFWLVVCFEFLGGVFLLLGKLLPRWLYKFALLGLVVIAVVALFVSPDWQYLALILATLVGLFFSSPKCLLGITGEK